AQPAYHRKLRNSQGHYHSLFSHSYSWSTSRINIRDSTSITWDFTHVHWPPPGIGRYPYPILTALDRTSESPFRSGPGSPPDVIPRQIGNVCPCAPLRDDLPFFLRSPKPMAPRTRRALFSATLFL